MVCATFSACFLAQGSISCAYHSLVAMFAASQAALYYTVKYMMKHLEGGDPERQKQLEKGNKTLERLGLKIADLDEHESQFIPQEDATILAADIQFIQ